MSKSILIVALTALALSISVTAKPQVRVTTAARYNFVWFIDKSPHNKFEPHTVNQNRGNRNPVTVVIFHTGSLAVGG